MIEGLPLYLTVVFVLTTALTVGLFFYAIYRAGFDSAPAKFLFAFVCIWLVATAVLAFNGFFQNFDVLPPRTFAIGVWPFLALTIVYLFFFRRFLGRLPLTALTVIHVIRIPVELCLLWLHQSGQVPVEMTFEGRNFDILSGLTAPLVYFLAFRNGNVNRKLLFVWNLGALLLLTNIVTIAGTRISVPVPNGGTRPAKHWRYLLPVHLASGPAVDRSDRLLLPRRFNLEACLERRLRDRTMGSNSMNARNVGRLIAAAREPSDNLFVPTSVIYRLARWISAKP
jgi:hypothetical protein